MSIIELIKIVYCRLSIEIFENVKLRQGKEIGMMGRERKMKSGIVRVI